MNDLWQYVTYRCKTNGKDEKSGSLSPMDISISAVDSHIRINIIHYHLIMRHPEK